MTWYIQIYIIYQIWLVCGWYIILYIATRFFPVIYLVHTCVKCHIPGIYQVYWWNINIWFIHQVYPKAKIHGLFPSLSRTLIDMVYTRHMPSICGGSTRALPPLLASSLGQLLHSSPLPSFHTHAPSPSQSFASPSHYNAMEMFPLPHTCTESFAVLRQSFTL
jgi:hypothetical protein